MSDSAAFSSSFDNIAALAERSGDELGISPWILIDQERINAFAQITEDQQWIHTDPAMAAQHTPFGGTIAHGFLVLSLASKVVFDTYKVSSVKMGLNYGLDRVRFITPVPVNSEIRGRVRLLEVERIEPNGGKVKVEITFEIKGQEKPACVATFIGMIFE